MQTSDGDLDVVRSCEQHKGLLYMQWKNFSQKSDQPHWSIVFDNKNNDKEK